MPPLEPLHQFEKGADAHMCHQLQTCQYAVPLSSKTPFSTHTSTQLCRGCVAAMLSNLTISVSFIFSCWQWCIYMKHQDIFESGVCKIFCSFSQWKLCTPVHLSQIIGGNNKVYLSLSLLTAMKQKFNCSQVPRTSLLKINITSADYTKLSRLTNLLKTREQKVFISINFRYLK